ncbi:MAG TPA: 2-amino-4-hydroxy-6-hydroxymethyldihydropteridine diphosphokinase [Candidatus Corynebacterium gallistercoris]|uniref:2-amino-4-hydroxy-6-hydroxymethyldihydropteridine diphosphokinase n=1 Tax=Candidatus Corynebacterium gallistercoris TaxID=2838530 RepID=A0A9D1RXZ9_9CORY|nr:2-amino-4-hydroxy-6-hydroxymethyldihydropteridine diphosphokinase [Candidatus Corynebacterium gallistercoris]
MIAYLGLGSNVSGDVDSPEAQIMRACEMLEMHPAITITARSRVFRTPPWGGVEQSEFRNAVIAVDTSLSPLALLHHCQFVEAYGNRTREVRWGPRTIDVDVLFCSDGPVEISSNNQWGFELVLPHPYAHERGFVLLPWLDIAPDVTLRGRSIADWAAELDAEETAGIEPVS